MYQVKDAMSQTVVSISPDATVEHAIQVLLDHNVSGAPVIDSRDELCGIISQFQLLEVMYDPHLKDSAVRDFMTREVLTIDENALLGSAANLLVVHRIHRLPVLRDGAVVGIISRSDLLRYFVQTGEKIEHFFEKLKSDQGKALEPVGARPEPNTSRSKHQMRWC
jgi:CBS-domain-containing membrane protein